MLLNVVLTTYCVVAEVFLLFVKGILPPTRVGLETCYVLDVLSGVGQSCPESQYETSGKITACFMASCHSLSPG